MAFNDEENACLPQLRSSLLHSEGRNISLVRLTRLGCQLPVRIGLAAMTLVAAIPAQAQSLTARDRDFYWYGIGAGIAITVCELERNGEVGKGFARKFIKDARANKDITQQPKTVQGLIEASRSSNCRGL